MRRAIAAAALILAGIAGPAFGQSNTGTTIGEFTLIEPGARVAAMGNAGVSLYEGIQAIYYNPAAAGPMTATAIQFSHGFWLADITYDYAAVALPVRGLGSFFGSVTALNSGDIDVRTVDQPLGTGERYSVTDLALGIGFGRQITSRFAAGAQVNYLAETIWHSSSDALTFSMGTVYRLAEEGLTIGASLANFGTRARLSGDDLAIQWDRDPDRHGDNSALPANQYTGNFPVPVMFRVGLSLPRRIDDDNRLLLAVDAFHPNNNTESLSAGAEWSWKEIVAFRAGYQNLFQRDSETGPTAGVGLRPGRGNPRLQFDYAWAYHERLQDTHRLTFALLF